MTNCPNCGSWNTAWDRNYCYDCGARWYYKATYSTSASNYPLGVTEGEYT